MECVVNPLMSHHIADQRVDLVFHDFPPFGIITFIESAALTGTCSSQLQLRTAALHIRQMRQLQNAGDTC